MVRVEGSLVVARRTGSRGSFSVGDLVTSIGEFKVKDAILDQFEPGEYRGEFVIKWIQPATFAWRGRVSVENRATLSDIIVHSVDERDDVPSTQTPPERDPMDERPEPVPPAQVAAPTTVGADEPTPTVAAAKGAASTPTPASPVSGDEALFGDELYPLFTHQLQVKLDPTLDREQFRKQRDRLKAVGYRFDAKLQAWQIEQAEEAVS